MPTLDACVAFGGRRGIVGRAEAGADRERVADLVDRHVSTSPRLPRRQQRIRRRPSAPGVSVRTSSPAPTVTTACGSGRSASSCTVSKNSAYSADSIRGEAATSSTAVQTSAAALPATADPRSSRRSKFDAARSPRRRARSTSSAT
ncbi:hypothetical protein [Pseudaquabacterium terrae]|uniref:hypothetical protein n=1 Tax=Pseudaquabacterium terrae TaxID=2732868 RepID=UPI001FEBDF50|nr:hypothetical protein [Aquabacterium terrae]